MHVLFLHQIDAIENTSLKIRPEQTLLYLILFVVEGFFDCVDYNLGCLFFLILNVSIS